MSDFQFTSFSSHTSDRCTGSTFKQRVKGLLQTVSRKPASIKGLSSFSSVGTLNMVQSCNSSCLEGQDMEIVEYMRAHTLSHTESYRATACHTVTLCHLESQYVTQSHTKSQYVTPTRSESRRLVLSQAESLSHTKFF